MPRINKRIYVILILVWMFIGASPVFAQVMESKNYRLELEEGEISPIGGLEGKITTETGHGFTAEVKDKFLSALSPDHPDFWKAVLLVGVIVILLALFTYVVARNWSLKRKEKLK